jgi:arylsulfatase A-like enzyme
MLREDLARYMDRKRSLGFSEAWEGGYRAPMVIRWLGVIKPGTVHDQMFASLNWLPNLCRHRRRA